MNFNRGPSYPIPEDDICGAIVTALIAEACALGIIKVEQRDLVGNEDRQIWIREIESALSSPPLIISASPSDL